MAKKKIHRTTDKPTGRPMPLTSKAGVTRDGKRRYGCGGKIKK